MSGAKRNPAVTGGRFMDISVLLGMALKKNHIAEDLSFKTLSERFSEVVGPLVLPHVSLVKLEKGFLFVKADSSAWKNELFLQKNAIIEKCNLMLESHAVRGIRLV